MVAGKKIMMGFATTALTIRLAELEPLLLVAVTVTVAVAKTAAMGVVALMAQVRALTE